MQKAGVIEGGGWREPQPCSTLMVLFHGLVGATGGFVSRRGTRSPQYRPQWSSRTEVLSAPPAWMLGLAELSPQALAYPSQHPGHAYP